MDKFYMVHKIGGGAPKQTHPTFEAAATEAERLASQAPGQQFVVLEAVAVATASVCTRRVPIL